MTITSITLKGGTVGDPLDITELYDANKYNDWGMVTTADGLTYDIGCKIIIGDAGVTETHFDLRKAGNPVVWRFGDEKNGLELNLGGSDTAILRSSTITTIGSIATTGLKVVAGTETHITAALALTISVFNTFVNCAAGAVLGLANPAFALSGKTAGAGTVKERYTWDITVLEGTTPVGDCKVLVKDTNGATVTNNLLTDQYGQIATQTYEANYWTAGSATAKTPHTFRFYEYSYTTATPVMAVSSAQNYMQQMIVDPFVTKSKTDAGLIDASVQES